MIQRNKTRLNSVRKRNSRNEPLLRNTGRRKKKEEAMAATCTANL